MTKYKQEKANSENRPLKKRESTLPKREDDKVKQLAVMQPAAPVQRVAPHVSHWGPPIPPPVTPQWGPYGVWVPYPSPAPMQGQQRRKEPASPVQKPSVFSRLNNGQSSSSSVNQGQMITFKTISSQGSERAPMRQVYVPKKVEALVIPPLRARPQSVITISSMEAHVINHDGSIIIEETLAQKQDEVPKEVAGDEKREFIKGDSKYRQPVWCSHGLNKTQWRKLQHARHKQQKREMLAKMGG
jgi:hypothetical protein